MMTSYDGPGTENDTTYTYDIALRRIKKDVNETVTKFIYDAWGCVAEYDGSNNLQASYVSPGLDQNLTIKRSGSTYYYHQDGLSSIRNITDSSEVAQNTYDYYAFGLSIGTPTENVTNDYRYTGRRWDRESSLHYYRARMYAATYARFTTPDPLIHMDGVSQYIYVRNRPTIAIDPTGKTCTVYLQCNLSNEYVKGCTRHCEYICIETQRVDSHGGTLGCEDLPSEKMVFYEATSHTSLLCILTKGRCKPGPCKKSFPTQKLVGDAFDLPDRSCSKRECKDKCDKAKDICDALCGALKGPKKKACKAACVAAQIVCHDICNAWCENP